MIRNNRWIFLAAFYLIWKLRYRITIFFLYNFLTCTTALQTAKSNCTTGFFKNELQGNRLVCCSHICEIGSRYNQRWCCNYNDCKNSYPNVCQNQTLSDLSAQSLVMKPTLSTLPRSSEKIETVSSKLSTRTMSTDKSSISVSTTNADKSSTIHFWATIVDDDLKGTNSVHQAIKEEEFKISTQIDITITQNKQKNKNYIILIATIISIAVFVSFVLLVCVVFWYKQKHRPSYIIANKVRSFNRADRIKATRSCDSTKTTETECQLVFEANECGEETSSNTAKENEICEETSSSPAKLSDALRVARLFEDIDTHFNYLNSASFCIKKYSRSLPNPSWIYVPKEIHPGDLIVQKKIGCGYFGLVLKGTLLINSASEHAITVAIKTLNSNEQFSSDQDLYCLQLELKILLNIGHHVNIITLLGFMTKRSIIGDFVIVTEYCELGDLQKSLLCRKAAGLVMNNFSNPLANELNLILENNYVCWSALLMYALQIANGAYYLSNDKMIIHRDLALRNMLLSGEHIVKIGDFGLAVNESVYESQTRKFLPTRWMAPESLNEIKAVFTSQSDVWSFGVTLWELISLADDPTKIEYVPTDRKQFRQWLLDGNRFKYPASAPVTMRDVMNQCWFLEPQNRGNFLQCRNNIQVILNKHSSPVSEYVIKKLGLEKIIM